MFVIMVPSVSNNKGLVSTLYNGKHFPLATISKQSTTFKKLKK